MRTCPHCAGELPDPTPEELAELLGTLGPQESVTANFEFAPQAVAQGIGRWVDTPDGPAFVIDLEALADVRAERARERNEARRRG